MHVNALRVSANDLSAYSVRGTSLKRVKIFLDNEEVKDCLFACEDSGFCVVLDRSKQKRIERRLDGKVELRNITSDDRESFLTAVQRRICEYPLKAAEPEPSHAMDFRFENVAPVEDDKQ